MTLRVLGCSGAISAGCRTTAFLLDTNILIDAGSGVGDLTLDEMVKIDHIFLSHSHLDHVLAVPLLADTVMRRRATLARPPIQVYSLRETIEALRAHVLNGVIWPDFSRLPTEQRPVLSFESIEVGQVLTIGGRHIEVLSANHTVPAVGFAISTGPSWLIYTGDTGPNPKLWNRLKALRVGHLVIETAFSDEDRALAQLSRHLCPGALGLELGHLDSYTQVHITHIKPGELRSVMAEIERLRLPHAVAALTAGQVLDV